MRCKPSSRGFAALDAVIATAIAALAVGGLAQAWRAGGEAARRADWLVQIQGAAQTNLELHWREAVAAGTLEGRSLDDRFIYRLTAQRVAQHEAAQLWRLAIVLQANDGRLFRLETRRLLEAPLPQAVGS